MDEDRLIRELKEWKDEIKALTNDYRDSIAKLDSLRQDYEKRLDSTSIRSIFIKYGAFVGVTFFLLFLLILGHAIGICQFELSYPEGFSYSTQCQSDN